MNATACLPLTRTEPAIADTGFASRLGPFARPLPDVDVLLFDLDGTLISMRTRWIELRFLFGLVRRFRRTIPPWRLRRVFGEAIDAFQHDRTGRTNYIALVEDLAVRSRGTPEEIDALLQRFVRDDFARLAFHFRPIPGARETLLLARELGFDLVLATNPVFPLAAVRMRLEWGGLGDVPFRFISHSEVMTRCKPSVEYYRELLDRLGIPARRCVMIGNDPEKDLPATWIDVATLLVDPEPSQSPPEAAAAPFMSGRGTLEELRHWMVRSAEARSS